MMEASLLNIITTLAMVVNIGVGTVAGIAEQICGLLAAREVSARLALSGLRGYLPRRCLRVSRKL